LPIRDKSLLASVAGCVGQACADGLDIGRSQDFVDGRTTAGWSAKLVKSNLQASDSSDLDRPRALVKTRLASNPVFPLATRPKAIIGPLFSRYQPGHAYGTHVDNALLNGLRTDMSFTLFLSDPACYDGGELVIDQTSGEDAFKLAAGSLGEEQGIGRSGCDGRQEVKLRHAQVPSLTHNDAVEGLRALTLVVFADRAEDAGFCQEPALRDMAQGTLAPDLP
jgi:hypothetical protein